MDRQQLTAYWRAFFSDLFLGTFINFFLFSLAGFLLGAATLWGFKIAFLDQIKWSGWLEISILILALGWYCFFGTVLGLISAIVHTAGKKLSEMMGGLQALLDLLTRGMVEKFPKINKNIPRHELETTFDSLGNDFLLKLKLKKGFISFVSGLLFAMILKALKFFFLDDVVEELSKKKGEITPSDVQNAVRRVGVEMVLMPLYDNFFLLQILIGVFCILMFAVPFGLDLIF